MVSGSKAKAYKKFAERLEFAARLKGIEKWGMQSEIARLANVTHRAARKWLDGDSMPDMANGSVLANKLGVSFLWLMAEQGPMKPPEILDPEGLALAICWPGIPDDVKNVMRGILRYAIDASNPGHRAWEKFSGQALHDEKSDYDPKGSGKAN